MVGKRGRINTEIWVVLYQYLPKFMYGGVNMAFYN